jgi:hypothetical protein
MTAQLKSIYLARRNPLLSRAAFTERWRRHGELAMSLPFWRHHGSYYHNDVLDDPPRRIDTQFGDLWSVDYDGVGVAYLPSAGEMESLIKHPSFPVLLADEWGAFSELVEHFSLVTVEELHKNRLGTAIKMFAFLRARSGVAPNLFADRWRAHASLVLRAEPLTTLIIKYAHNLPAPMALTGEGDQNVRERIDLGLTDVAGITELGFASRSDMETYLAHPARDGLREDLEQFADLDRTIIVATNEVTMYTRA